MSARRHERLAKQQNELQDNREELEDQLYRLKRQPDTDERKQKILETNQELLETNQELLETNQELLEAKIKLVEAKIETLRAAPNSEEPEIQIQILNKQIELLELQISSTTDQEQKNQLIGLLRDRENRLDRLTGATRPPPVPAPLVPDLSIMSLAEELKNGMKIQQEELVKMRQMLDASNSEKKSMSKVNSVFTHGMLDGYGIEYSEQANREPAQGPPFNFSWKRGEEKRTPAALKKIQESLEWNIPHVELTNARNKDLNLHVPGKATTGQLDGLFTETRAATFFGLGLGGVELKTNRAEFKILQMILELMGLSIVSTYRQGVTVLGTDLNKRWVTLHFDKPNHILVTTYECGHVALSDFRGLLQGCGDRKNTIEPQRLEDQRVRLEQLQARRLAQIPENSTVALAAASTSSSSEQDLSDTAISPAEAENLEQFQRLQAFAAHLSSLHGCVLHAPSWGLNEHSPMSPEHSPMSPEHSPMSQDARRMFG